MYYQFDGWEEMPSAGEMESALEVRIAAFRDLTAAMRAHPNVGASDYYRYLVPRMKTLQDARARHQALEKRVTRECIEHQLEPLHVD